jgi:transposase
MAMRKSRISKAKQEKLIEYFVAGTTGRCAAELVGVNFKTACYFYQRLRELIAAQTEREANEVFAGEIEVDESYFGGHRKGNRGRGAAGKVPVFGLLKRGGKVYTKIIRDASGDTLIPIIEKKVIPDSIVYSDCWEGIYMCWMYLILSTTASIIPNCLRIRKTTSMELRISGTKPSVICVNLMVFQRTISGYF